MNYKSCKINNKLYIRVITKTKKCKTYSYILINKKIHQLYHYILITK